MADYTQLKVTELKELVKERNIPSTGLKLKQHYIDALVANDEEEHAITNTSEGAVEPESEEPVSVEDAKESMPEPIAPNEASDEDYEQDADNENRKRKRRSATPSLEADTVNKKLRSAEEEHVQVAEDVQAGRPDDIQEDKEIPAPADLGSATDKQDDSLITGDDRAMEDAEEAEPSAIVENVQGVDDSTTEPSRHQPTRALYIYGLVRPLQSRALAEHLTLLTGSPADSDVIETCYLDMMKTHALVLLNSESAATRARSGLHAKVWPEEPMRKPLWVDYVPEDKVQEWIDIETDTANAARWEVVYSGPDLNATAMLQEISFGQGSKASTSNGQSSNAGQGVPGAPLGPRQRSPPVIEQPNATSFLSLDERFIRTEAKPRLYYKPVSDDRFRVRFDNLMDETNPEWEAFDGKDDLNTSGSMRRYTFEDDKVVDSGPDFGIFGRPAGAADVRGGRGGGRGYGRGGGRGRRGDRRGPPRNGDYYAPTGYAR